MQARTAGWNTGYYLGNPTGIPPGTRWEISFVSENEAERLLMIARGLRAIEALAPLEHHFGPGYATAYIRVCLDNEQLLRLFPEAMALEGLTKYNAVIEAFLVHFRQLLEAPNTQGSA